MAYNSARKKPKKDRIQKGILSLSRFPSENPSPVLRFSGDGNLLYINKAGALVFPKKNFQQWREQIKECLKSGKNKEIELKLNDRFFSFALVPIVPENYVNAYGHDITESKRVELVLRRLSDIGALAATVAHELRNPLGVMRLAAYNIKKKDKEKIFSENIDNLEKTISDSEQIINNLLFYSKIRSPHPKKVDLITILRESITQSRNKFKEWKAETKDNFNKFKPIFILADPTQLREVFANILNNALEALPDKKGKIEIECEYDKKNLKAVVKIKDDGVGIDPADLNEIFRPFFTRKARGMGLGLAVCSQIVALHGGRIEVSSQKGAGAAFMIHLPALEQEV